MRMRNKPWAGPELDACPFFERSPWEWKGRWKVRFSQERPMCLELGCGKGYLLAGLAPAHPEYNYIGVDMKDAVLAPAKRVVEAAFAEAAVENVALLAWDIERLSAIMDESDRMERIYICFCNPWPRPKHYKRRLTHPRQLALYKPLLAPGGEIWFKTDDDPLFQDSLHYFEEAGFTLKRVTYDLHSEPDWENVVTEHERMFTEKGIQIKALVATLNSNV